MKIHHKLLIMNLSLAFIPMMIAGLLAFRIGTATLNQLIGKSLQENAYSVINSLDQDLYERIRSQRSWANLRMMQDVIKGDPDGKIANLLHDISENNSGIYHSLLCVSRDGIIIAASSPSFVEKDVSQDPWFKTSFEKGLRFVGIVPDMNHSGKQLIGIVQPIRTYPDRTKVIGAVVSFLNWNNFAGITEQKHNQEDTDQDSKLLRIVDPSGVVLFQSYGNPNLKQEEEEASPSFHEESHAEALTSGKDFFIEFTKDGEKYLSGVAHSSGYKDFDGFGWSAILSIPHKIAFLPVYSMGKQFGVMGILCLILIPIIATLFSKGITLPLTNMIDMLKDLAKGEGDLTRRIQVESNDEIKELADWMNTFTENIQGIIRQIKETVKNVYTASNQITQSTERVFAGTEEQSKAIQEITASMYAMDKMNRQIVENTGNLAGHTDEASSSIVQMSASIDEVAESAKQSFRSVEETASSITQMAISINEISSNINTVSSNADQTSAFTEEIDRTIQEVERNAKSSLDISEEAVKKASGGMNTVIQTQDGMVKIKETFEESSRVIKRLGEKSVEIGKILRVIDEVSDQTNLLALNAAIIAAQAGEHGKGFAVVADEIKALAERSATSSSHIAEVVRDVQRETEGAVQSMEISFSSITHGMDLSSMAAEALQQNMAIVNQSKKMIEEISHATVEQAKGSQMVKKAVGQITESLRKIATGTQEQKVGSKQIAENTDRVHEMIAHVNRAMQEQAKGSTQIIHVIEEINNKTREILTATDGQTKKSHEVLSNSKRIEQVALRNTLQSQEMSKAISDMAEKVECLQNEVDKFKV